MAICKEATTRTFGTQTNSPASASPSIVGTLGCLQRILRASGRPLTPALARKALRATGSPQQDAPGRPRTQRIGNRPDLLALVKAAGIAVVRVAVPTKATPKKITAKTKKIAAKINKTAVRKTKPAHARA